MVDKAFFMPQPIQPKNTTQTATQPVKQGDFTFQKVLQEELFQAHNLKMSRHAQERLATRNIKLSNQHIARLQEAVDKAQGKGCRESLVVIDDLAFVVSIRNRTVITAVDGDNRRENIFTNIDSAVIN